VPSKAYDLEAAIASADKDMLNYLAPMLGYLASGEEAKDSYITAIVEKRKASITVVRKDGVTFVVTVEKQSN
jgi:hypothetical protein